MPRLRSTEYVAESRSKRKWTDEEDRTLGRIVEQLATSRGITLDGSDDNNCKAGASSSSSTADRSAEIWGEIAACMPGRSVKQCRERYQQHLSPGISRQEWSGEEETAMFQMQAALGNAWVEIARQLPGRTDSHVKNRYYSALRRVQRAFRLEDQKVAADLLASYTRSTMTVKDWDRVLAVMASMTRFLTGVSIKTVQEMRRVAAEKEATAAQACISPLASSSDDHEDGGSVMDAAAMYDRDRKAGVPPSLIHHSGPFAFCADGDADSEFSEGLTSPGGPDGVSPKGAATKVSSGPRYRHAYTGRIPDGLVSKLVASAGDSSVMELLEGTPKAAAQPPSGAAVVPPLAIGSIGQQLGGSVSSSPVVRSRRLSAAKATGNISARSAASNCSRSSFEEGLLDQAKAGLTPRDVLGNDPSFAIAEAAAVAAGLPRGIAGPGTLPTKYQPRTSPSPTDDHPSPTAQEANAGIAFLRKRRASLTGSVIGSARTDASESTPRARLLTRRGVPLVESPRDSASDSTLHRTASKDSSRKNRPASQSFGSYGSETDDARSVASNTSSRSGRKRGRREAAASSSANGKQHGAEDAGALYRAADNCALSELERDRIFGFGPLAEEIPMRVGRAGGADALPSGNVYRSSQASSHLISQRLDTAANAVTEGVHALSITQDRPTKKARTSGVELPLGGHSHDMSIDMTAAELPYGGLLASTTAAPLPSLQPTASTYSLHGMILPFQQGPLAPQTAHATNILQPASMHFPSPDMPSYHLEKPFDASWPSTRGVYEAPDTTFADVSHGGRSKAASGGAHFTTPIIGQSSNSPAGLLDRALGSSPYSGGRGLLQASSFYSTDSLHGFEVGTEAGLHSAKADNGDLRGVQRKPSAKASSIQSDLIAATANSRFANNGKTMSSASMLSAASGMSMSGDILSSFPSMMPTTADLFTSADIPMIQGDYESD